MVALSLSTGTQTFRARRKTFVPRRHETGVAKRPQVLGGVEAEGGGLPERAESLPPKTRPVRLAGVFDHGNVVAGGGLDQLRPARAGAPEDVYRNDRPNVLRFERSGDGIGIQAQAFGLDVGEDRDRPGALDADCRVAGGKRSGQDPVAGADPGGRERQRDGVRARGHSDCMLDPDRLGEGPLERFYLQTEDEAAGGEYPLYGFPNAGVTVGREALKGNLHAAPGPMARTVSAKPRSRVVSGRQPRSWRIADQSEWKSPIAMAS